MLTKRLAQIGNSAGLIIDRPLLDLLDLQPGAEVQLEIEAGRLIVTPTAASVPAVEAPAGRTRSTRSQVMAAHKQVMAKHGGTLKKLAK